MEPKQLKRKICIAAIVMCLSFQQFTRLSGIDNIRAIQVVTLLACGMGLGIFVENVVLLIRNRKGKD